MDITERLFEINARVDDAENGLVPDDDMRELRRELESLRVRATGDNLYFLNSILDRIADLGIKSHARAPGAHMIYR